jgi:hypothetical protein
MHILYHFDDAFYSLVRMVSQTNLPSNCGSLAVVDVLIVLVIIVAHCGSGSRSSSFLFPTRSQTVVSNQVIN